MRINLQSLAMYQAVGKSVAFGREQRGVRRVEVDLLVDKATEVQISAKDANVVIGVPAGQSTLIFSAAGRVAITASREMHLYTEELSNVAYSVEDDTATFLKLAPDDGDGLDNAVIERLYQRMQQQQARREHVARVEAAYERRYADLKRMAEDERKAQERVDDPAADAGAERQPPAVDAAPEGAGDAAE